MFKLKFWFNDENGERSSVAPKIMGDDKSWHTDHWERFSASYRTKTTEWAHEQEYRLILYSLLQRFDDIPSRKLKYKFSDLIGVIFGIKTTTEDKIRIMRIIEQKCRAEGRTEFEFHQAYYSRRSRKIELGPLSLIKFA